MATHRRRVADLQGGTGNTLAGAGRFPAPPDSGLSPFPPRARPTVRVGSEAEARAYVAA